MSALWPFPDRVAGWVGASRKPAEARLPGPLGLPAYARLARTWAPIEPRLERLVAQLAALRSGCDYCVHHNRHAALKAGVAVDAIDAVAAYAGASQFSESERAALALADAVTGFRETEGGFPMEILVRARCHFAEGQIVALVAAVAAEHFFDPATGGLGRDSIPTT